MASNECFTLFTATEDIQILHYYGVEVVTTAKKVLIAALVQKTGKVEVEEFLKQTFSSKKQIILARTSEAVVFRWMTFRSNSWRKSVLSNLPANLRQSLGLIMRTSITLFTLLSSTLLRMIELLPSKLYEPSHINPFWRIWPRAFIKSLRRITIRSIISNFCFWGTEKCIRQTNIKFKGPKLARRKMKLLKRDLKLGQLCHLLLLGQPKLLNLKSLRARGQGRR